MAPVRWGEQYQDGGEVHIAKEDVEREENQSQHVLEGHPSSDILQNFIKILDFFFFIFVFTLHFTRSADCSAMYVIGACLR